MKRYIPFGLVVDDKSYIAEYNNVSCRFYTPIAHILLDMSSLEVIKLSQEELNAVSNELIYYARFDVSRINVCLSDTEVLIADKKLYDWVSMESRCPIPIYTSDLKLVDKIKEFSDKHSHADEMIVTIDKSFSPIMKLPTSIDINTLNVTEFAGNYFMHDERMINRFINGLCANFSADSELELFNYNGAFHKHFSTYYFGNLQENSQLVLPIDCKFAFISGVKHLESIVINKFLLDLGMDMDFKSTTMATLKVDNVYIPKYGNHDKLGKIVGSLIYSSGYSSVWEFDAYEHTVRSLKECIAKSRYREYNEQFKSDIEALKMHVPKVIVY